MHFGSPWNSSLQTKLNLRVVSPFLFFFVSTNSAFLKHLRMAALEFSKKSGPSSSASRSASASAVSSAGAGAGAAAGGGGGG